MFFPEFLFQISQRDRQVTWLDPVFDSLAVSAANVLVESSIDPHPTDDRAFILQSAIARGDAGAAQTCDSLAIAIQREEGGDFYRLALTGNATAIAAGSIVALNWSGSVIVPPGWNIKARGNFNAGANANQVDLDIVGMLIPIGNIQRI